MFFSMLQLQKMVLQWTYVKIFFFKITKLAGLKEPIQVAKNHWNSPIQLQKWSKSRFWNPDRTVRSDRKNLELFSFTVYLGWRTVPYKKSRDPHGPRSDRPVLWTVTGFWGSDGFFLFRLFRWIWPIHRYKFMIRSRRNERTWREQRLEGDLIISDLEQRDL